MRGAPRVSPSMTNRILISYTSNNSKTLSTLPTLPSDHPLIPPTTSNRVFTILSGIKAEKANSTKYAMSSFSSSVKFASKSDRAKGFNSRSNSRRNSVSSSGSSTSQALSTPRISKRGGNGIAKKSRFASLKDNSKELSSEESDFNSEAPEKKMIGPLT